MVDNLNVLNAIFSHIRPIRPDVVDRFSAAHRLQLLKTVRRAFPGYLEIGPTSRERDKAVVRQAEWDRLLTPERASDRDSFVADGLALFTGDGRHSANIRRDGPNAYRLQARKGKRGSTALSASALVKAARALPELAHLLVDLEVLRQQVILPAELFAEDRMSEKDGRWQEMILAEDEASRELLAKLPRPPDAVEVHGVEYRQPSRRKPGAFVRVDLSLADPKVFLERLTDAAVAARLVDEWTALVRVTPRVLYVLRWNGPALRRLVAQAAGVASTEGDA